jgi:hypothetical protein
MSRTAFALAAGIHPGSDCEQNWKSLLLALNDSSLPVLLKIGVNVDSDEVLAACKALVAVAVAAVVAASRAGTRLVKGTACGANPLLNSSFRPVAKSIRTISFLGVEFGCSTTMVAREEYDIAATAAAVACEAPKCSAE